MHREKEREQTDTHPTHPPLHSHTHFFDCAEPEQLTEEELTRIEHERALYTNLELHQQNGIDLIVPEPLKLLIRQGLIGAEYDAPMVVVVGKESDGKSITLSRTIERPIFPYRDNICTVMPIKLHLRTREKPSLPKIYAVELQDDGTKRTVPTRVHNHTGPNHDTVADIEVDHVPLRSLQEAIDQRMQYLIEQLPERREQMRKYKEQCSAGPVFGQPKRRVRRPRPPVSLKHEIVVELEGPYFPNLTIVDLPGVVSHDVTHSDLPLHTRCVFMCVCVCVFVCLCVCVCAAAVAAGSRGA